ncbi:inactive pancreatic lipase-related protein 1 [Nephila pilipes]|uniref:Inactive pancreatic lipase-related protein 1 n=1 Tax=Nephila pilipes TaxID=299642 RepID=A0A8X6UUN2_NEPPI|nr:inactive pancreatic lipase-related protein 1 [Nephila pilipes]
MRLISFFVAVSVFGKAFSEEKVSDSAIPGELLQNVRGVFQNKCIEDLGCFYTGPPFYDPVHRPLSLPPFDGIETKFILYSPPNWNKGYPLKTTEESVVNSNFLNGLSTKILIHPYIQKLIFAFTLQRIKKELLKTGLHNVIMVDWSKYNQPPYPQAVANGRVVGAQTAKLIKLLIKYRGVTAKSFHVIGHSLGGQICGWVGERIPNLGRITGLDPAGPYFHNGEKEIRLDPTDAAFVDVIHTNGGNNVLEGLGIDEPVGDMDFYVNGGKRQPGCRIQNNGTSKVSNQVESIFMNACNHLRVVSLFLDSINTCTFKAVRCENYESFQSGECNRNNSMISEMGYKAQKIANFISKFYVNTNDKSPFCNK